MLTAQVAAVTAQVQGAKVTASDFLVYGREQPAGFPPAAAAVAIALKAEGKLPRELIPVWPAILDAAEQPGARVPQDVRWLAGDNCWLLAPTRTERGWEGLLVVVEGRPAAVVELRDGDRPYRAPLRLKLPRLRYGSLAIAEARLSDA